MSDAEPEIDFAFCCRYSTFCGELEKCLEAADRLPQAFIRYVSLMESGTFRFPVVCVNRRFIYKIAEEVELTDVGSSELASN